ncbi:alpha/beta fold hydrolase [Candidatus Woesearchaeota archaeon]|nr:alpha/beta fold hydrolase [Candidatus Woesearchaeota archaeon]
MKFSLLVILILLLLIAGCNQNNQKINNQVQENSNFMKVNFKTSDNVNIVGNYYDVGSDKNVILLHRLNMDKRSWGNFPTELKKNGFNVLAIDLRGHGESGLKWNNFNAKDFNDMVKDVEAAITFMKSKHQGSFFVIGESIGANTALNYALQGNVDKIVLLSPGLDYRGIKTDASNLRIEVLFVTSKDDSYSYESVQELYQQAKEKKELKVYDDAGHGTNMFVEEGLSDFIINWLRK